MLHRAGRLNVKVAVYLSMLLLLGPMLRFAGVVISALFLLVMVVVGLYLIFHRKDRAEGGPQQAFAPPVVVLVAADQWPYPVPAPAQAAAAQQIPAVEDLRSVHPARRPREDRPPLWVRPGQ
jgi:hypothetical protein